MVRTIVCASVVTLGLIACSSATPSTPFGGTSSSSSSSSSGGDDPSRDEGCYRLVAKATGKGACVCGTIACLEDRGGVGCGCVLGYAPVALPNNGVCEAKAPATRCCIGPPEGGSMCRCNADASCEGGRDIDKCDRANILGAELAHDHVVFEDDEYRMTGISRAEVDARLADGRATKMGNNILCDD